MRGKPGGVAQLARALAWHARGHGFKSRHLQKYHKVLLLEIVLAQFSKEKLNAKLSRIIPL